MPEQYKLGFRQSSDDRFSLRLQSLPDTQHPQGEDYPDTCNMSDEIRPLFTPERSRPQRPAPLTPTIEQLQHEINRFPGLHRQDAGIFQTTEQLQQKHERDLAVATSSTTTAQASNQILPSQTYQPEIPPRSNKRTQPQDHPGSGARYHAWNFHENPRCTPVSIPAGLNISSPAKAGSPRQQQQKQRDKAKQREELQKTSDALPDKYVDAVDQQLRYWEIEPQGTKRKEPDSSLHGGGGSSSSSHQFRSTRNKEFGPGSRDSTMRAGSPASQCSDTSATLSLGVGSAREESTTPRPSSARYRNPSPRGNAETRSRSPGIPYFTALRGDRKSWYRAFIEAEILPRRRYGRSDELKKASDWLAMDPAERVVIQIDGEVFVSTKGVLEQSDLLKEMMAGKARSDPDSSSPSADGSPQMRLYLDADPDCFREILRYLRTGTFPVYWTPVNGYDEVRYAEMLCQARMYQIPLLERWLGRDKDDGFELNKDVKSAETQISGASLIWE